MSSCQYIRGPPLNSDISGIGVRISFYLQTLFLGTRTRFCKLYSSLLIASRLGFLSARSGSSNEIAGALYTLMATNTAMAITGLILGLKPGPEISFQEYVPKELATAKSPLIFRPGSAVVVLYLLSMSWIVVIASLASCNRLSDNTKLLQLASVIQSYIILAFAFAVLATADRFGSNPECNQNTVAVIFRPFSALKSGRIFGWIVVSLAFMCYTAMTARDYTSQILKKVRKWEDTRTADEATPLPQQQCPVPEFTPPKIPTARKISQRQVRWLFVWLSK